MDKDAAFKTLNRILELKLAGVVHCTNYALMVHGHNRIPIIDWLHKQAEKELAHARMAGELIAWLGWHPSLCIGPLLGTSAHDMGDILRRLLAHENEALKAYHELLNLARSKNVRLEHYARSMIAIETAHQDTVNKMLRKPGQKEPFVMVGGG